jgi:hypothetical protein
LISFELLQPFCVELLLSFSAFLVPFFVVLYLLPVVRFDEPQQK